MAAVPAKRQGNATARVTTSIPNQVAALSGWNDVVSWQSTGFRQEWEVDSTLGALSKERNVAVKRVQMKKEKENLHDFQLIGTECPGVYSWWINARRLPAHWRGSAALDGT